MALVGKAIPAALHTPEDSVTGNRSMIFPITESDCVVMSDNYEETLTDRLGATVKMSQSNETPQGPCLWLKVTETDM